MSSSIINQNSAIPANPEPNPQTSQWQPHQTPIPLGVLITAMQCVSQWMYENECIEGGGALYNKYSRSLDTVHFDLTWQDESGEEHEAPLINVYLPTIRTWQTFIHRPARVRLFADAFYEASFRDLYSGLTNYYLTARDIEWLGYAAAGFSPHEVTFRILEPIGMQVHAYQAVGGFLQYVIAAQELSDQVDLADWEGNEDLEDMNTPVEHPQATDADMWILDGPEMAAMWQDMEAQAQAQAAVPWQEQVVATAAAVQNWNMNSDSESELLLLEDARDVGDDSSVGMAEEQ